MSKIPIEKIATLLKDKLVILALGVASSLIATVLFNFLGSYIKDQISEWLHNHNQTIRLFIMISIFAVSVILIAFAFFRAYKKPKDREPHKTSPLILVFCGGMLLFNSLLIVFIDPPEEETIVYMEQNRETLRKQRTIDIPIKEAYQGLFIKIKYPEGEGLSLPPELELEKISPLKGDWENSAKKNPAKENSAEKLIIAGLEAVKKDECYYRPPSGKFEVQDINGKKIGLNKQNSIRINFRNLSGFKETIELGLYGIKHKER